MPSSRRELWLAVLLCLAGAGLALFAVTRTWVQVPDDQDLTIHGSTVGVAGSRLVSGVTALSLVGLAAVLAIIATRGLARRVIGFVVVLSGAELVRRVVVALLQAEPDDLYSRAVFLGRCPETGPPGHLSCGLRGIPMHPPEPHFWPVLTLLGGVLLLAGGGLVVLRGPRWPALGSSYTREPRPREDGTDKGVWDALDSGDDPTA